MKKIALLASHNGSHIEPICEAVDTGKLHAQLVLIVSNNTDAKALQKAKELGIEHALLNNVTCNDPDAKLQELLQEHHIDMIVLSGYMKMIPAIVTCNHTIINSHPSLLPKYGGKGMYGRFVHEAVIKNHEEFSGVTIHKVNEVYDEGEILLQRSVKLAEDETVLSLEKKIKALEKEAIIEVLGQCLR